MGNAADDRLEAQRLRKALGPAFGHTRDDAVLDMMNHLDSTYRAEGMSEKDILDMQSGRTRPPFGTPRPR